MGTAYQHRSIEIQKANKLQRIFSTGQVGKICSVAPRTVTTWCSLGLLKFYKIPGSPDRRIPKEHLIEFLRANGMYDYLLPYHPCLFDVIESSRPSSPLVPSAAEEVARKLAALFHKNGNFVSESGSSHQ